ncbi:tRNA 4-thiouridine(8) synthase ThiI [Strepomyces sp. STD 3.1]|nr:tRNA 4-thiouridine(8) synthase ThiI [Streptomyces sp. STD 3.1]
MFCEPGVPAPRTASGPQGPCVLLKHGEVFLKGRNRHLFTERLHDNLRVALRGIGGSTFHSVEPAVRVPSDLDSITAAAVYALGGGTRHGATFAVRARRRDKQFPLTSSQVDAYIGARVLARVPGLRVDLARPDVTLAVEIDRKETYLSWQRLPGLSGLPVGSSGRALVLLSGGYDSPVAAHRAMRRGLACDFVHFNGAPYTNPSSVYKAYALARELNRCQPPGSLHVIALGKAQKQLAVAGAGRLQVVAQRRLMVRTASELAARTGAEALVTGDSLGQVARQTLANMVAVDEAAVLPVLRPLIGWDKQEIIDEAASIGTAEISVLPDEDCCSLLAPPRVSTRAGLPQLRSVEKRLDLDEVVEALVASAQVHRPAFAPGCPDSPYDAVGKARCATPS